jgi:hypothetical protein
LILAQPALPKLRAVLRVILLYHHALPELVAVLRLILFRPNTLLRRFVIGEWQPYSVQPVSPLALQPRL